jgi:hypothetical protein
MRLETLENRQFMSSVAGDAAYNAGSVGAIYVTGDSVADQLLVRREGNYIAAYDGATRIGLAQANRVRGIVVNAGGGNDTVRVVAGSTASAVAANTSILGGLGNDTIYSGSGNDYIEGNDGSDVIITVGGGVDAIRGGTGRDSFWSDSTDPIADPTSDEWSTGSVHRIGSFMSYNYVASDNRYYATQPSKDLSGQSLADPVAPAGTVRWGNFSQYSLFGSGPFADEIRQGGIADCWMMSTFSGVARHNPDRIRQSVTSLGDGTYAARFYRNGQEVYYRVDADLPISADSNTAGAKITNGSIWAPILEKAYAMFRGNRLPYAAYSNLDGGWLDETFRAIGSAAIETVNRFNTVTDLVNWTWSRLSAGRTVLWASTTTGGGNAASYNNYIVQAHAYEVTQMQALSDGYYWLTMRNPWAMDGRPGMTMDGANDGYLRVRADQAWTYQLQMSSAIA